MNKLNKQNRDRLTEYRLTALGGGIREWRYYGKRTHGHVPQCGASEGRGVKGG